MTKLTLEKYEENAHSTATSSADLTANMDRVINEELIAILKRYVELARSIDTYKKAAFYGRNINTFPTNVKAMSRNGVDEQIFHGVLGIAGEAGEVVELMLEAIETGTLPETFSEELGDVLWYIAIAARAGGTSLEKVGAQNNKKLKDRWEKVLAEGKTDFKS